MEGSAPFEHMRISVSGFSVSIAIDQRYYIDFGTLGNSPCEHESVIDLASSFNFPPTAQQLARPSPLDHRCLLKSKANISPCSRATMPSLINWDSHC
jgi:hypothetical protein